MQLTLPAALTDDNHDDAVVKLREYFGLEPYTKPYTGAWFERLGGGGDRGEVRDVITTEDLVAVTMLSVDVPASAALQILGPDGREISDLLRRIPTALDLAGVDPELINKDWPGWRLWTLLESMQGIGWVIAGKLVARKRPRLLPVYDSIVREQVGAPADYWHSLNHDLRERDDALHRRLLDIRVQSAIGCDISALRVLDIVTWMTGRDHAASHNGT